jgi:mevalonate kinase
MKWNIPAKTFLVGEYAAIAEASAIILTTSPYFELSLTPGKDLTGIHPDSPAGVWWQKEQGSGYGLSWYDPYDNRGGLGASSAQFLASYLANCNLHNKIPDLNTMLTAYYQLSWSGRGLRPSGYDVIAQSQHGCVYINKQKKKIQSFNWPFENLSMLLIHTGVKLVTHHHLQLATLPSHINQLSAIADEARLAFIQLNPEKLIKSINDYHYQLAQLNLVAQHSLDIISQLKAYPEVLAIKGCGALGADILLVLTARQDSFFLSEELLSQNRSILATEKNITSIDTPPLLVL